MGLLVLLYYLLVTLLHMSGYYYIDATGQRQSILLLDSNHRCLHTYMFLEPQAKQERRFALRSIIMVTWKLIILSNILMNIDA